MGVSMHPSHIMDLYQGDFVVVKDFTIGAKGREFDSRANQIKHGRQQLITVATFLRCPGAKPRRWTPPLVTRFSVYREYTEDLI